MAKFYRKNQEIAPVVKAGHDSQEGWMREQAESRVRAMKDLFPEPKTRRLQPISRDIGRGQKRQVQAPCVNCNCRGKNLQVDPSQQEHLQHQLRQKFGKLGADGNQDGREPVEVEGAVDGTVMNQPLKKKFAPKNFE